LNSINLSCNDFAFSIKNFSSIVVTSHVLDFKIDVLNVGLSQEKFMTGLGLFSSIFSSTFCFIIVLIKESEIGLFIPLLVSFIFLAISSVVCLSIFNSLVAQAAFGLAYFSNLKLIFGKEKLNVYKIHTRVAISKTTIKDFTAVA